MVTFFLTELLVRQSRTYTVVDDVSEAQQNLRAVTGLIERELRSTGFMVPEAAAVCGWDMPAAAGSDTTPDVLYVSDADAIDPAGLTTSARRRPRSPGASPGPARTTSSCRGSSWTATPSTTSTMTASRTATSSSPRRPSATAA